MVIPKVSLELTTMILRYSNSASQSIFPRIPSQRLVWPANEPNPFLSQGVFYGDNIRQ